MLHETRHQNQVMNWLDIIEHPTNTTQNFDPIETGLRILSTFRFSKM